MRIVVPVKHVPDIHSDRQLTEDGRVARGAEDGTLNELDENAVEAALQLVEALGAEGRASSEVVALTVGPVESEAALRKAYQLGVDTAVRVTDDAVAGSDVFGTARAVAAGIRRLAQDGPVDLVITGMAALDGLGSVVPALLSAELGLPQLALAARLSVVDGVAEISRDLDGVTEVLTAPLPAVVSVTDHVNTPRYPNFKLIMAARTKDVTVWDLAELGLDPAEVGEGAARARVVSSGPRPPREPAEIVTDKGEGGVALAEYLIRNDLV
ncbi:electron transfer flavoprotein subunit beta/FixA family protein [Sanguibacter suaedae]|uniref:Electron transfer flavoprotein subunit beta n=1 Tax=Sanguibacter suaedae TaxID=2795737 RepID=A0A934I8B0_9MICO|nr:electron transfer flavoprotein subunit beta/FixA family protein [Sanguibacter suaedae]MBI9116071.1 electron transfer flavoprotein subunit beta/FixA family protein [Sanguibacter suaedae]